MAEVVWSFRYSSLVNFSTCSTNLVICSLVRRVANKLTCLSLVTASDNSSLSTPDMLMLDRSNWRSLDLPRLAASREVTWLLVNLVFLRWTLSTLTTALASVDSGTVERLQLFRLRYFRLLDKITQARMSLTWPLFRLVEDKFTEQHFLTTEVSRCEGILDRSILENFILDKLEEEVQDSNNDLHCRSVRAEYSSDSD